MEFIRNTFKQTEMHWQQRNVTVRFENKRIEDTYPDEGDGFA